MEQEPIIPTWLKRKIPHTLSYPIGAKAISDALRGVPQFDRLIVDFYFWNRMARRHDAAKAKEVLAVWYSGPIRFSSGWRTIEEQGQDPRWTIRVSAVPRSQRHVIQAKIVAEALPAIRSWLVLNSHATDREGFHGLTFSFDELEDELISENTASMLWQTEKVNR